jgi:hypothetical protein
MPIRSWSRERARRAIESLGLLGGNAEVAAHWLASWDRHVPPVWSRFDLAPLAQHLPAIAVFEVTPGERIVCLLAGSLYKLALGFELTGRDLIALTPERLRAERWKNVTQIIRGGVSVATRSIYRVGARPVESEELALPFADANDRGTAHYLVHSNWRPDYEESTSNAAPRAHAGLADRQRIVSFVETMKAEPLD